MENITLETIATKCKALRLARDDVKLYVNELQADIRALQLAALKKIKAAINRTADHHAGLVAMIDSHRDLFEWPRTQTFHGVRCGLKKGSGSIDYDDEDAVIGRIEKKLPALADLLVKTEKSLRVKALKGLDVSDLAKIGCTVETTGDYVFIKFADEEVDKLVNRLLASAVEEAEKTPEA